VGHSVALGACRRRSGADRTTGALARCRRPPWPSRQGSGPTLESGIRSAVIIPMRQQPGPMLIFQLTEDRRSRLDVGRHGGNPHSVPGAPVIPLRRHHEQLKNTRAVRGQPLTPRASQQIHLASEQRRLQQIPDPLQDVI